MILSSVTAKSSAILLRTEQGLFQRNEVRGTEADSRQKRYSIESKASFISYMLRREGEEVKSNLSWYAEYVGVSRTWLYKLLNDFKSKFGGNKPGPKTDHDQQLSKKLQEELRKRDEEFAVLKAVLQEQEKQLVGQKERIVRTILQASVCPTSAGEIRDLIVEAFGVRISKTKIKKLIAQYSIKARKIMQEMEPEKLVQFLGVDEIFCGSDPILTGVDLNSFAVVICERAGSRDHEVWHQALSLFPSLKLVTSDQAKGIIKAVYLCGDEVRHQFDLFHFKRGANRLLRSLEAKAYRKIESEYKAQVKMEKSKTDAKREQWQKKYSQRKKETDKAIYVFDRAERAINRIFDALDVFKSDGTLKDPRKSIKNLQRGVAMLEKTSNDKKIQNLAKQACDPRLLLYLTTLKDNLLSFLIRWKNGVKTIPRSKVIEILGRSWYLDVERDLRLSYRHYHSRKQWKEKRQQLQMQKQRTRLANLFQLRQLQMSLANYQEVFQAVTSALNQVFRSSSLVESFNSHVRIHQQVKKGLHKQFLSLVALKWNMSPFEEGKRKGKSPFQILGLQDKNTNWIDLLMAN